MVLFNIDWLQILGLLLGTVFPLLVAIVTRSSTNSGLKAVLLAGIALVVNLLTGIQGAISSHTTYNLGEALLLALATFIVAVASHAGFWKPTGVTAALQNKVGPSDFAAPAAVTPAESTDGGKHL